MIKTRRAGDIVGNAPLSFIRINTAAQRLSCHRSTIYRLAASGKLPRLVEIWPNGPQGFIADEFEACLKKQVEAAA